MVKVNTNSALSPSELDDFVITRDDIVEVRKCMSEVVEWLVDNYSIDTSEYYVPVGRPTTFDVAAIIARKFEAKYWRVSIQPYTVEGNDVWLTLYRRR